MAPTQPGKPTRKRNRKRKRRVASDSSSSEEDSPSSSESSTPHETVTIPVWQAKPSENMVADEEGEPSSSSDDSPDDSDSDVQGADVDLSRSASPTKQGRAEFPRRDSPSPPPLTDADVAIPPFVPPDAPGTEQALKEKFRKFWMGAIAEGFKDDLEEIRKEPHLGPSRLALLIESLASGADVFSSRSAASGGGGVNEMQVVLEQLS